MGFLDKIFPPKIIVIGKSGTTKLVPISSGVEIKEISGERGLNEKSLALAPKRLKKLDLIVVCPPDLTGNSVQFIKRMDESCNRALCVVDVSVLGHEGINSFLSKIGEIPRVIVAGSNRLNDFVLYQELESIFSINGMSLSRLANVRPPPRKKIDMGDRKFYLCCWTEDENGHDREELISIDFYDIESDTVVATSSGENDDLLRGNTGEPLFMIEKSKKGEDKKREVMIYTVFPHEETVYMFLRQYIDDPVKYRRQNRFFTRKACAVSVRFSKLTLCYGVVSDISITGLSFSTKGVLPKNLSEEHTHLSLEDVVDRLERDMAIPDHDRRVASITTRGQDPSSRRKNEIDDFILERVRWNDEPVSLKNWEAVTDKDGLILEIRVGLEFTRPQDLLGLFKTQRTVIRRER